MSFRARWILWPKILLSISIVCIACRKSFAVLSNFKVEYIVYSTSIFFACWSQRAIIKIKSFAISAVFQNWGCYPSTPFMISIKAFGLHLYLFVVMLRPVKDYNEIANHFIECAHAHCCNTRLQVFSTTIAYHAIHAIDIFIPFALCIEIMV